MKSQARLRLRQAGRHRNVTYGAISDWTHRHGLNANLVRAFEMNCYPKHYANDEHPVAYWTINYVTGMTTWHGPVSFHGVTQ